MAYFGPFEVGTIYITFSRTFGEGIIYNIMIYILHMLASFGVEILNVAYINLMEGII